MKKIGLIVVVALFASACNNSADNTSSSDSTSKSDNTNVYDTGSGSSMTDTAQRMDTSAKTGKMQDTSAKK